MELCPLLEQRAPYYRSPCVYIPRLLKQPRVGKISRAATATTKRPTTKAESYWQPMTRSGQRMEETTANKASTTKTICTFPFPWCTRDVSATPSSPKILREEAPKFLRCNTGGVYETGVLTGDATYTLALARALYVLLAARLGDGRVRSRRK